MVLGKIETIRKKITVSNRFLIRKIRDEFHHERIFMGQMVLIYIGKKGI